MQAAVASKENIVPTNNKQEKRTRYSVFEPLQQRSTNTQMNAVETAKTQSKRLSQGSTASKCKRKAENHIGPWRLGRTLGRGSTGRVRLAKHRQTGQLAAIKIIPKSLPIDQSHPVKVRVDENGLPYGIEREIIIMKLISHPNIMGLYDVWENKNHLYLVLEYVEGGELFDFLVSRGRLSEREAAHYFSQIIDAVAYCHKFQICHRDLKPENILLDRYNNIKIADFGMAALETKQKLLETSCGSPHYAAPEIVSGKAYHGSPSDVWSCGVILFALLTGHLPFDDSNIRTLLLKVQSGRFYMPPDLSSEAKSLIWSMLRVKPEERIPIDKVSSHPFIARYHEHALHNAQALMARQLDNLDVSQPILHPDSDILHNLQVLWRGAPIDTIIDKLRGPGQNSEKMFYYLLEKYKESHSKDGISFDKGDITIPQSTNSERKLPSPSPKRRHRRKKTADRAFPVGLASKRKSIASVSSVPHSISVVTTTIQDASGAVVEKSVKQIPTLMKTKPRSHTTPYGSSRNVSIQFHRSPKRKAPKFGSAKAIKSMPKIPIKPVSCLPARPTVAPKVAISNAAPITPLTSSTTTATTTTASSHNLLASPVLSKENTGLADFQYLVDTIFEDAILGDQPEKVAISTQEKKRLDEGDKLVTKKSDSPTLPPRRRLFPEPVSQFSPLPDLPSNKSDGHFISVLDPASSTSQEEESFTSTSASSSKKSGVELALKELGIDTNNFRTRWNQSGSKSALRRTLSGVRSFKSNSTRHLSSFLMDNTSKNITVDEYNNQQTDSRFHLAIPSLAKTKTNQSISSKSHKDASDYSLIADMTSTVHAAVQVPIVNSSDEQLRKLDVNNGSDKGQFSDADEATYQRNLLTDLVGNGSVVKAHRKADSRSSNGSKRYPNIRCSLMNGSNYEFPAGNKRMSLSPEKRKSWKCKSMPKMEPNTRLSTFADPEKDTTIPNSTASTTIFDDGDVGTKPKEDTVEPLEKLGNSPASKYSSKQRISWLSTHMDKKSLKPADLSPDDVSFTERHKLESKLEVKKPDPAWKSTSNTLTKRPGWFRRLYNQLVTKQPKKSKKEEEQQNSKEKDKNETNVHKENTELRRRSSKLQTLFMRMKNQYTIETDYLTASQVTSIILDKKKNNVSVIESPIEEGILICSVFGKSSKATTAFRIEVEKQIGEEYGFGGCFIKLSKIGGSSYIFRRCCAWINTQIRMLDKK